MASIKKIIAREILDSRGLPTIESIIELADGSVGAFATPSGISIGKHEAVELRDGDVQRFAGKGVLKALINVHSELAPLLIGKDASDQENIDQIMIKADGTPNKGSLGANSILSLSIAVAKAQAASEKLSLYRYIAKIVEREQKDLFVIPTPMFNILNGGKHGGGNIDFQEFLIVPPQSGVYSKNLQKSTEIYYALKDTIVAHSGIPLIGDEGGYAPTLFSNSDAFKILEEAVIRAGYKIGLDVFFSIDAAASYFMKNHAYKIKDRPVALSPNEFIEYFMQLNEQYHLLSIEDGLHEDDWGSWQELTEKLGKETLIIADDLVTTNLERLKKAIEKKACNGVVIKPNQVGTLTETLEVVKEAKKNNVKTVVSHRSGETNDDFISDFAVGIGSDYLKFGAPARGERVAKYNRLLEIEHEIS